MNSAKRNQGYKNHKNPEADLRNYYTLFLEVSLALTLVLFIGLVRVDFNIQSSKKFQLEEQEVVEMEEIIQTEHVERVPPPPRPPVPQPVPNDEIIEDVQINIDAELTLDGPMSLPAPPPQPDDEEETEKEEDFFVIVEQMPELIGGLAGLQSKIQYPEMARRAGIEGRVYLRFIVNEKGEVENPVITRGIGGGCDEEAIRAVKQAKFKPGMQRGKPVRVQYSLPIVFRLQK
ncbi:MAG: energy transducer TonB [Balneolaceae bacterium]